MSTLDNSTAKRLDQPLVPLNVRKQFMIRAAEQKCPKMCRLSFCCKEAKIKTPYTCSKILPPVSTQRTVFQVICFSFFCKQHTVFVHHCVYVFLSEHTLKIFWSTKSDTREQVLAVSSALVQWKKTCKSSSQNAVQIGFVRAEEFKHLESATTSPR